MLRFIKQFGGRVSLEDKEFYGQSPHWKNGKFQNAVDISMMIDLKDFPRVIRKQFFGKSARSPEQALPIQPFDKTTFLRQNEQAKFIWYGHSVLLANIRGKICLIDPMLGPDTTPIAPTVTKRFSENTLDLIEDFPPIDILLMTHDHYDHLDYASILRLKPKVKQYFVAMGVKRHLVSWGVESSLITEFDWWDSQELDNCKITFTPTQHFSGRGLTDRFKTLWGGWVFQTPNESIWFSGDGGYGNHFTEIGERLGPFDLAFMECGQYNTDWHPVHLFPEESIRAALDAGAKTVMPVHWAGFDLSYYHTWKEPAEQFVHFASEQEVPYLLPQLGEIFTQSSRLASPWWENYS